MESHRALVPALRKAGPLATVDYALAFAVLATAGWLLFTAEKGTHASFRFGLIAIGGAAFCLVVNGVMLVRGRDRRPMFRSADAQFLATLRQGALRIWLFGLLLAAIGSGVALLVPNSHPLRPQVSGTTMAVAIAAAAVTVVASGVSALVVRRAVPKPPG
ncbi:hypothetical protein ACFXPA_07720 [Amycolatopsis sp. NPDC059090]|uniref:hypothetical protein n=1 Tax=unclassified Amycolatopsis TaxID=2618356 RepID=UPI00366AF97E